MSNRKFVPAHTERIDKRVAEVLDQLRQAKALAKSLNTKRAEQDARLETLGAALEAAGREHEQARAALRLVLGNTRHAIDVLSTPSPAIVDTIWAGSCLTLVDLLHGVVDTAEGALKP